MKKIRIGIGYTGNIKEEVSTGIIRPIGQNRRLATKSHSIANSVISIESERLKNTNIGIEFARLDTGKSYGEKKRELVLSEFDTIYILKDENSLVENLPYLDGKTVVFDIESSVFSNKRSVRSLAVKVVEMIKYNETRKELGVKYKEKTIYYFDVYEMYGTCRIDKGIQEYKIDSFESFLKSEDIKNLYLHSESKKELIHEIIRVRNQFIKNSDDRVRYLNEELLKAKKQSEDQTIKMNEFKKKYEVYM